MGANERIGGGALLVAAGGTVLAMGHHPSGGDAGLMGQIMHGIMILFLGVTTFGFATFAAARGAARPAILSGIVFYALALIGHTGAATISGFVVPALASRGDIPHDLFDLAWEANQALASLGVVAAGAAIILWSMDFLTRRSAEARTIGVAGLVAGGVPAILLLTGVIEMNLSGAFLAYALHGIWGAALGFHLFRGKVGRADGEARAAA